MTAEPSGSDRAVVRLIVERLAPPPAVRCNGWCSSGRAVLTLPQPGGGEETLSVPVLELVTHLAALVGLDPRPRPVPGSNPPSAPRLHWRIETTWHGPGGKPAARSVAALDGGDDGWWLVGEEAAQPQPTTATELFRRLCRLLPTDAELG